MFYMLCALLGILCSLPVFTSVPWNDPCNVIPHRIPRPGEVETVKFTRECTKGQISWDYPQGTLQVNFAPISKVPFQLCLKNGHAGFVKEIYNLVDGRRVAVEPPSEGNDSCIKSHNGEVQLVMVAPTTQFYMSIQEFYTSLS